MRIRPGFFGTLLTRSGRWELAFDSESLLCSRDGDKPWRAPLHDVSIAHARAGVMWAEVNVGTMSHAVQCDGVANDKAVTFIAGLREAVGNALMRALAEREVALRHLSSSLGRLLSQSRYIARHDIALWRADVGSDAKSALAQTVALIENPLLRGEATKSRAGKEIALLKDVLAGKGELVASRNKRFVSDELDRHDTLFESVETQPLTSEQRTASVVMEDRNLVVAAAGSGKTSTLVGKVGYALLTGTWSADEILVLAFNRAAANELRERINGRLASLIGPDRAIKAMTFHSLGMEIITAAEDEKPSVQNFAGSNEAAGATLIGRLVQEQIATDQEFAVAWITFRALCFAEAKDPAEFKSLAAWDAYVKANGTYRNGTRGFLTLNGDLVKSQGELAIANWLYMQGIEYEYERPYKYRTADRQYRQYCPDFYFPEIDTYLEHYALDHRGRPPPAFAERYLESMRWKAQLHEDKGTALITTTFADFVNDQLFGKLEAELKARKQPFRPRPLEDVLAQLNETQRVDNASLLDTFLKHAKSNECDEATLFARAQNHARPFRARLFVRVVCKLMAAYEAKLQERSEIDFEDMIIKATKYVASGAYRHPYRLILVDEFQDISQARAKLLKAMLEQVPDCKLFAVGDDWQSINRFAGADVDLFTRFAENFGATARCDLTRTFRSCQGIADVASEFVQKNPVQLKKTVVAEDPTCSSVVEVATYGSLAEMGSLCAKTLERIAAELAQDKRAVVFLLARYRKRSLSGVIDG